MARPPINDAFFDGDDTAAEPVEPNQIVTFSQNSQVIEHKRATPADKKADPEEVTKDE